jgi:hypothetical protein
MAEIEKTAPNDGTEVKLDFTRLAGTTTYEVTLPDGKKLVLERSRERAVPGLGSLGASTSALYDLAMHELGDELLAGTVVDLGSGCGIGARQLLARGANVVAVESDAGAASMARFFAARATVIHARLEEASLSSPADGAVMIDVLGFVESPIAALRAARRTLRKGGKLVVVEPLAFPSQCLVPPARRAASPSTLAAIIESVGFSLLRCGNEGGVVIATAEAIDDPHADALTRGAEACGTGELERALTLFDVIGQNARHHLAVQAVLDAVDVLVAQGRADDACSRLLAILRRFPDEPRPLAALSQFMVAASEPAEARLLAEKAARLAPLEPAVIAALAIALQLNRDPESATTWRRAFNLAPDALEIALPAAAHALETGHPLLADRILTRCMAYAGNAKPEAFCMRARVRIALGRTEDAKLDARVALAAAPTSEEAQALVATLEASSAA